MLLLRSLEKRERLFFEKQKENLTTKERNMKMGKITSKSTKDTIYQAYKEAIEKIAKMEEDKFDPVAEKEAVKKAEMMESADKIIESGILNDSIVEQYLSLEAAIEEKNKELKEMYSIEKEANTLVALINAHKDKEKELKEEYALKQKNAADDFEQKKQEMEEKIEALSQEFKSQLNKCNEEYKEHKEKLAKERAREEEEYTYSRDRARKLEEDRWTDEKNARMVEMEELEASVASREEAVSVREEKLDEMEAQIKAIPDMVEEARQEGIKKGKSDAEKSHVFEKRQLETEFNYQKKDLEGQVERLKTDLAAEKALTASLQEKLDGAYAQMRDLAADTVKSNGGVKILDRESSSK